MGTSPALAITGLVEPGVVPLERAIALMTSAPASILNLPVGVLREGAPADVTVFDPKAEWTVDPEDFASLSRNTPFAGCKLRGVVLLTVCDGRIVYKRG